MLALVVENNPMAVELLSMRLQTLDCEIVSTGDPALVVPLALQHRPDFILLDLGLGTGEAAAGVQVLYALRASEAAHIPTILHSVFVNKASDAPLLVEQADGILPKPFQFVDLQRLVASIRELKPVQ
ncbi:MAG: response regulator receiver protein [Cyanobacteria bacterium RYN_339]|nr:response regulator receiver protein [Cyanobacteria bacterium RYN_339]